MRVENCGPDLCDSEQGKVDTCFKYGNKSSGLWGWRGRGEFPEELNVLYSTKYYYRIQRSREHRGKNQHLLE